MESTALASESKRKFEVTSSMLKWLAIIMMILNHICYGIMVMLKSDDYFTTEANWFLTRGAFVIFAFLIAEGMHYTHDRKKYIFSLFAFAIISEIPFDLVASNAIYSFNSQNVFFTLGIGALSIVGIDYFKGKPFFQFASVFIGCVVATYMKTDYAFLGVGTIASFYAFREVKWKQLLFTGIVFTVLSICDGLHGAITEPNWELIAFCLGQYAYFWRGVFQELHGLLVFPLIALYHGKKGRNINKWFFYGFYPGHLLLIWVTLKIITLCIQ